MRSRWALGMALSCLVASCSSSESKGGAGGATSATGGARSGGTAGASQAGASGGALANGGAGGAASNVTWAEHIAPIVFRECVGCHRDGGIAPFSLTSYAAASPLASLLAEEVAGRWMPPMPVDNSGACNTYSNARWLSDAEIALLDAWAKGGAPEGDPSKVPALPTPPKGIENPSAVLDTGVDYTPDANLFDDYRCFLVDSGISANTFLVGYEVLPGDAREVHHLIAYQPNSDAEATKAAALDDAEAGPGYTCFGGPGVEAEPRVLWAPGAAAQTLPSGTGLPLVAGRKLIMQVHYNLVAGAFPDRTRVRLVTSNDVSHPASYVAVADTKMNVAPGLEAGVTTRSLNGIKSPIKVYGAMPHMHTLGRKLRVDAAGASGNTCLVDVVRWDFHWQNAWWYKTPLSFDSVSNFNISCTFDTRSRTTPVTWGEGTSDEMCISYFYITAQ